MALAVAAASHSLAPAMVVLRSLLEARAAVDVTYWDDAPIPIYWSEAPSDQTSALALACRRRLPEVAGLLLGYGADPNWRGVSSLGMPPPLLVLLEDRPSAHSCAELLALLLDARADVHAPCLTGLPGTWRRSA